MNNKSTKTNTKFHQTGRKKRIVLGVLLSIILVTTPFLFYLYRFAPTEASSWDTVFGTIEAGNFTYIQSYIHAALTKITFVLLTGIWFLTSKNWWKYAILVPFTMFLFQLSGVLNYKLQYIDEYDFWYSLPVVLPILFFLIYISIRLNNRVEEKDNFKEEVDDEIHKIFSDDL